MKEVKTVIALFTDQSEATNALHQLDSIGYSPNTISLLMKDSKTAEQISHETGVATGRGAATGAATGAALGGLAGLLIGIGAITLPGIGAILVGGPLATALGLSGAAASTATGALTGAVAGGLIGALMNLGMSQKDAEHYERRLQEGAILLAIPAYAEQVKEVEDVLHKFEATDVRSFDLSSEVHFSDTRAHHSDDTRVNEKHEYAESDTATYTDHTDSSADLSQVERYLKHADFPASKHQLLLEARDEGANSHVVHTLESLPDQRYESQESLHKALGNIR